MFGFGLLILSAFALNAYGDAFLEVQLTSPYWAPRR